MGITGSRFGRLVINDVYTVGQVRVARCLCDCGIVKEIRLNHIKSGAIVSCGCYLEEVLKAKGTHRDTIERKCTSEYRTWSSMLQRCNNPKVKCYKNYGGRGITVCSQWQNFENFLRDMGRRPTRNHTLERIDNNSGYSVDNCKWSTNAEQASNKRTSRFIVAHGLRLTIAEWSKKTGISQQTISARIHKHKWSEEDAVSIQVYGKHRH